MQPLHLVGNQRVVHSVGSRVKNFLTWIGSGQCFAAKDGSAIFGLGLEISPKNHKFFYFFPLSDKKKSLWVGSKTGQPLYNEGQRFDWFGSRPISSRGFNPRNLQSTLDPKLSQKYTKKIIKIE